MLKDENEMELLSAYIDGELEESEKNKVASFLAQSPRGRKALERLRHTKGLLISAPTVRAPSDFLDLIEAQAEKTVRRRAARSFWRWSNPWAWTPTFAAVAVYFVALGLRPSPQIPFESLLSAHQSILCGNVGIHQQLLAASHTPFSRRNHAKA